MMMMTTTTSTMVMMMMMTYSTSRMGTQDNPDLQLGLVTTVFTMLLLHMTIPFLSSVISIMTMLLMMIMAKMVMED